MFLIHVSVRPDLLVRVDEIVFPLLLYGKTFWLVSFFLYYPNNKFFSIYNYLFRFYFSLFGFQWTFVQASLASAEFRVQSAEWILLVEMMGFGRSANYALWSPSALTVHRTVIHYLLCSNPLDSFIQGIPLRYLLSHGGDDGIRTHDPLLAGQVLSQLSYTPII